MIWGGDVISVTNTFCGIYCQQYQIYWEKEICYRDTAIMKSVVTI